MPTPRPDRPRLLGGPSPYHAHVQSRRRLLEPLDRVLLALTIAGGLVACDGDLRLNDDVSALDASSESGPHEDARSDVSPDTTPPLDGSPRPGCKRDADCALASLHCDVPSGACVACVDDSNCKDAEGKRCDTATHLCVECGLGTDCGDGLTCEPVSHHCVHPCGDGAVCPSEAPTCDEAHGYCVSCGPSTPCPSSGEPVCAAGRCVGCARDEDCTASDKPRCDVTVGKCVSCNEEGDCLAPKVCDPSRHECVEP